MCVYHHVVPHITGQYFDLLETLGNAEIEVLKKIIEGREQQSESSGKRRTK